MEFSFAATTSAKKEKVWSYYADIQKWYDWEDDLKNISLDGAFQTGIRGIMELEGMPPLSFELCEVKEIAPFGMRPRRLLVPSVLVMS